MGWSSYKNAKKSRGDGALLLVEGRERKSAFGFRERGQVDFFYSGAGCRKERSLPIWAQVTSMAAAVCWFACLEKRVDEWSMYVARDN